MFEDSEDQLVYFDVKCTFSDDERTYTATDVGWPVLPRVGEILDGFLSSHADDIGFSHDQWKVTKVVHEMASYWGARRCPHVTCVWTPDKPISTLQELDEIMRNFDRVIQEIKENDADYQ